MNNIRWLWTFLFIYFWLNLIFHSKISNWHVWSLHFSYMWSLHNRIVCANYHRSMRMMKGYLGFFCTFDGYSHIGILNFVGWSIPYSMPFSIFFYSASWMWNETCASFFHKLCNYELLVTQSLKQWCITWCWWGQGSCNANKVNCCFFYILNLLINLYLISLLLKFLLKHVWSWDILLINFLCSPSTATFLPYIENMKFQQTWKEWVNHLNMHFEKNSNILVFVAVTVL